MGQDPEIRKMIVPYLLDELPPEERATIEDRYFDSDTFFQEMVVAEDELVESYLLGELSGDRLDRFRDQFLTSPARRQKVEITRALLQPNQSLPGTSLSSTETPAPQGFSIVSILRGSALLPRWLVFAATVFLILGGLAVVQVIRLQWQMSRITDDRAFLEQHRQELENESVAQSARVKQLTAELERARSQPQQGLQQAGDSAQRNPSRVNTDRSSGVATGILFARLIRGVKKNQILHIPATATVLRLQVNLELGNYESYRAIIKDDNREIVTKSNLKGQKMGNGYFITMEIPVTQLSAHRNYLLTVSGVDSKGEIEDIGLTYFSVVRK